MTATQAVVYCYYYSDGTIIAAGPDCGPICRVNCDSKTYDTIRYIICTEKLTGKLPV